MRLPCVRKSGDTMHITVTNRTSRPAIVYLKRSSFCHIERRGPASESSLIGPVEGVAAGFSSSVSVMSLLKQVNGFT